MIRKIYVPNLVSNLNKSGTLSSTKNRYILSIFIDLDAFMWHLCMIVFINNLLRNKTFDHVSNGWICTSCHSWVNNHAHV